MARKIKKAKKTGKKLLKAHKPTPEDLSRKSKRTGYRFKTDHLKKKSGEPTKLAKKLRFKKPTTTEIEKYKKNPDGTYPDKTKEIYHERRADRKHSDDNLKKKFDTGGAIESWRTEKTEGYEWVVRYLMPNEEIEKVERGFETEQKARDWAKEKIGVNKSIILEAKSFSIDKEKIEIPEVVKHENGGDIRKGWLTISEVKEKLGRDLHWWKDDVVIIDGVAFDKCFLQPFYKPVEMPEEKKVVNIDLTQPAI